MFDPAATRYCTDCTYMARSEVNPADLNYARCLSPKNVGRLNSLRFVSPADEHQEPARLVNFCDAARGSTDFCGPAGDWFEPKAMRVDE